MHLKSLPVTQADLDSLAAARGVDRPDQQWICTPFDTWEKNPYYSGPDQRHPEDDYDENGRHYLVTDEEWAAALAEFPDRDVESGYYAAMTGGDEIPF